MPAFRFLNFAESRLARGCSPTDTALVIEPQDAVRFQFSPGEQVAATLFDGVQEPEIVYITANPGNGSLVVERGRETTGAKAWNAGTLFAHTVTAGTLGWFSTQGWQVPAGDLQQGIEGLQAEITRLENLITTNDSAHGTISEELRLQLEEAVARVQSLYEGFVDRENAWAAYEVNVSSLVEQSTSNAQLSLDTANSASSAVAQFEIDLGAALGDIDARFSQEADARAELDLAISSLSSTVDARFGEVEGSVTVLATAQATLVGNVNTKYSVTLNADGSLANFALIAGNNAAGQTVSQLVLGVNQFLIKTPNGQQTVFAFDTQTATAYLQNVYVDFAFIRNVVITTALIADLAVSSAKIAMLAVGSAHIQDAAIKSAHIEDLSVGTVKITNRATTDFISFAGFAEVDIPGTGVPTQVAAGVVANRGGEKDITLVLGMRNNSGARLPATIWVYADNRLLNASPVMLEVGDFQVPAIATGEGITAIGNQTIRVEISASYPIRMLTCYFAVRQFIK